MEDFLSTLPNYVHNYLNKRPATETFHLLRELISFAVLYSNDRDIIVARTQSLLDKGRHKIPPKSTNLTPVDTAAASNKLGKDDADGDDDDDDDENVPPPSETASETSSVPSSSLDSPRMPNTFPDWWGHQDFEPDKTDATNSPTPAAKTTSNTAWIPSGQKESAPVTRRTIMNFRTIPNLRSYLDSPATSRTAAALDSSKRSPTTASAAISPSRASLTSSTDPVAATRSASAYRPGQTATVRARAEQAKARQQKLEEDKAKKLRQQSAKSSPTTHSDTIKKERRKTMPVTGSFAFHTEKSAK